MPKPVTTEDYFDLMQKMVNPAGYPFQSLMFPVLDIKEVEKKIAELESVEHWLKANLGILQLSIKTLQYQKALLTPSEDKKTAPGAAETPKWDESMMNPAVWAMQLLNQASEQMQAPTSKPAESATPKSRSKKR